MRLTEMRRGEGRGGEGRIDDEERRVEERWKPDAAHHSDWS